MYSYFPSLSIWDSIPDEVFTPEQRGTQLPTVTETESTMTATGYCMSLHTKNLKSIFTDSNETMLNNNN